MLQEWKLNLYAAEYKINIDASLYKNSEKKKFNRHDSDELWSKSIKDQIKWFTFITIMEHTANIRKINKGIILSLLKLFAMF